MKKKVILIAFFLVILLLLVFYFLFFMHNKKQKEIENLDLTTNNNQTDIQVEQSNSNSDQQQNNSNSETLSNEKGYFVSENYKIDDIQFGGSSPELIYENNKDLNLDIYDIKDKVLADAKKKKVNLLINWKTNKLAISEVEYYPKKGGEHKFYKEENFGFNHDVVISDIVPSAAYVYKIKCRDSWGKEKVSDSRAIYTGKGFASIFDMISEAFGDMFGWMSK